MILTFHILYKKLTFPFSKTLQQFHIDLLTYEQEILDTLLLLSPLLNDKSSPINMYISVYMHLLTDSDPTKRCSGKRHYRDSSSRRSLNRFHFHQRFACDAWAGKWSRCAHLNGVNAFIIIDMQTATIATTINTTTKATRTTCWRIIKNH